MLSEKGIDKIEKLSKSYGVLKNSKFALSAWLI